MVPPIDARDWRRFLPACDAVSIDRYPINRQFEQLNLEVNGEVVAENHRMKRSFPSGGHTLAIGGYYWYEGASVRFDELEIRRLSEQPDWVVDEE